MRKFIFLCTILVSSFKLSAQEIQFSTGFEINNRKNEFLNLVGEVGDNFIVEKYIIPRHYAKSSEMYLLDKSFKIIQHKEMSTQYKTGRGGYLPEDLKNFIVFNGRLIAEYSMKEKKDAVIYYDEYDPKTFNLISEKNELFRYTYPGLVNARDWISYAFYQYGKELIMDMTIYGIEGGITAGNHKGAIIRYTSDLKKINQVFYEEDQLGSPYDLELLDNGEVAFLSFDKSGDKFFVSTVSKDAKILSIPYLKEGKYFDYWSHDIVKGEGGDYLFAGLYSDTEYNDKENTGFQGVYLTKNGSKKMNYISFASLAEKFSFSPDGYLKRKNGEAEMDTYYSPDFNTVYLVVYNTGKVSSAKVGVISYKMNDGTLNAADFEIPGGKFSYYEMETIEGMLRVKFIIRPEKTTENLQSLSLVIDAEKLSDPEWEKHKLEKAGDYFYEDFDCQLDCEYEYFILFDSDANFHGVMRMID